MRTVTTSLLLVLAACSAGDLGTGPADRPIGHPDVNASIWSGEKACAVGLVRVDLQLSDQRLDPSQIVPTGALLRVTVDGALHTEVAAARLRVDGAEIVPGTQPRGDLLEVFVGFGGNCDWVTVHRIG